jgi:hypothetical protein
VEVIVLLITPDVFSGRPNPSSVITDEGEVRATLKDLLRERALLTDGPAPDAGLGLRGFSVELLSDELAADFDAGSRLFLPVGPSTSDGRASELAERLIALLGKGWPMAGAGDAAPVDEGLQQFLRGQLDRTSRATAVDSSGAAAAPADAPGAAPADVTCQIEFGAFNPGFWNNDANVRLNNNCYNYASNKRTNTFAQPGRGCGHMYTAITCAEVTRGALCDGLHRRFDCFPATEKPRYLVAMVVAPGPGFIDYHWYRKQKEGYWGHKPGSTAARNLDNSNQVIVDPVTCDRGPYTQFCGFFYTCVSQKIN